MEEVTDYLLDYYEQESNFHSWDFPALAEKFGIDIYIQLLFLSHYVFPLLNANNQKYLLLTQQVMQTLIKHRKDSFDNFYTSSNHQIQSSFRK